MDKAIIRGRVAALREQMKAEKIDVCLIRTDDFHMSEYVSEYFRCRAWMSGFTGSVGTMIVAQDYAAVWVDSRYYLQATEQLRNTGIEMRKEEEKGGFRGWLKRDMKPGSCLAYDGRTVSVDLAEEMRKTLARKQITIRADVDLVDRIWTDRPPFPANPLWELPVEYSGEPRSVKMARVRECLKAVGVDRLLLASLDDVAWMYHFRGSDVAFCPVFMGYTILSQDQAILYVAPEAVGEKERAALEADGVEIRPYLQVYEDLKKLKGTMWLDKSRVNSALMDVIPGDLVLLNRPSPTTAFKAKKTPAEMENERIAHIQDGVAVTKVIYWMKKARDTEEFRSGKITEKTIEDKYYEFRSQRPDFIDSSFLPIVGTGYHGAIVHYSSTPETDIPIQDNTFLLMDTGGNYMQGTTDITRTMAVGELTHEMKVSYTAVLRGNLNLGGAVFPKGTNGQMLEHLAKDPLWQIGMTYYHGTGHGVGYLLIVHEGPQKIRSAFYGQPNSPAFEEGMLTSNEPGVYLEGRYGIRCENLMLCVKDRTTEFGDFLKFETITMAPWERSAILPEMMTEREIAMLDEYHAMVYDKISPWLTEEEREWLKAETRPIREGI